jgi:dihydroorotase
MSATFHLALPYLDPAQAQKHVTHNEALRRMDAVIHLSVITRVVLAPPDTAQDGARYLIGTSPTGIFTGHAAIELYAEAFESVNALDKLENFTSVFGAQFYGLPISSKKMRLVRENWIVPETFSFGTEVVIPLRAGQAIAWKIIE